MFNQKLKQIADKWQMDIKDVEYYKTRENLSIEKIEAEIAYTRKMHEHNLNLINNHFSFLTEEEGFAPPLFCHSYRDISLRYIHQYIAIELFLETQLDKYFSIYILQRKNGVLSIKHKQLSLNHALDILKYPRRLALPAISDSMYLETAIRSSAKIVRETVSLMLDNRERLFGETV